MTILNIENVPFIWTWARPRNSPQNLEPPNKIMFDDMTTNSWFSELHNNNEKYFCILFMHHDAFSAFPIETLMSPEEFQMLKNGEMTLLLENSGHGYNENVGGIYKDIIIKHDIDPNNVILRTESADMHDEVRLISQHLYIPEIKLAWIRQFECQFSSHSHDYQIPNTLQIKHYEKKFLSYNGLFRPHRGILIFLLQCYGILDKGLISYNVKDNFTRIDTNNHVTWFKDQFKNFPDIVNLLEANREQLTDLIKIELDDFTEKNTAGHYEVDNHYYEETYFSLVTETSFPFAAWSHIYTKCTDTGRILSEKIFKPVLNKHPFIVASNYQTLALFKKLGYQSFHPYINESYDEILDDKLRLIEIAKEVKRLSELSGSELEDFLINCKRICEQNFEILRNKKWHVSPLNY